jgi:hypothetical protein
MGFLDSILGGSDTSTTTSTTEPWQPQQQYLTEGFQDARSLYRDGANQYYGGNTVAGLNPSLQGYMTGGANFAGQGAQYGQGMMQQGQNLAGGLGQAQGFYNDAMSSYFNPYASQQYQDIMQNSGNPMLQNQIDMAQSGINRNLQENILPSIGSAAVGTNNTANSRRGLAEGVAMRGASEQGANVATQLQGQDMNRRTDLANRWAGGQQQGQQYQMNAANNMAGLGQFGSGMQQQGYGLGSNAYQDLMGSGMMQRAYDQDTINADRERFDFGQNAPWQNLQRYQQSISGNYGGTTTQVSPTSSSMDKLIQSGTQLYGAHLMGGGGN